MRTDIDAGHTVVIADGELLSDDMTVCRPVGREAEATRLRACLNPMRQGQPPLNAWLYGPPGSGKTTLARWTVDVICSATDARLGVYVNCWQHRSLYSVAQAIIDKLRILGAEAQDTNVKLDRIRQAFRVRPAVVVLDEIDRPMPAQREEILHGMLSLPKTGVMGIANTTQVLASLDDRVRSRLSPVVIELPAYTTNQIHEIVTDRARRALMPGMWSPPLIDRIADAAGGDARLAIELLRHAAATAEEAGRDTIDADCVNGLLQPWETIRREARLVSLAEHERLIQKLAMEHGPLGTTALRRAYVADCRRQALEPVARRTFSKYLARLASAGMLNVTGNVSVGGRIVRAA